MKENNYIRLEFPSRSSNESFARAAAAAFAAQLDPTMEELGDLRTAVSEAVTNAIVHAYPDSIGKISMRMRILDESSVEISVRDWGCGIEDIALAAQKAMQEDVEKAMTPLYTSGGEERSGMGFTIMGSFTDRLRVRSEPGRGTTVTMRKHISPRARRT